MEKKNKKIFKTLAILLVALIGSVAFVGCSLGGAEITQDQLDGTISVIQSIDDKYEELIETLKDQTEAYEELLNQLNQPKEMNKEDAHMLVKSAIMKLNMNYDNVLNNLKVTQNTKIGMGEICQEQEFISHYFLSERYSLSQYYYEENDCVGYVFHDGTGYVQSFETQQELKLADVAVGGVEVIRPIPTTFEQVAMECAMFDLFDKLGHTDISSIELLESGNYKICYVYAENDGESADYDICEFEVSKEGYIQKVKNYSLLDWKNFYYSEINYEYNALTEEEIKEHENNIAEIIANNEE